MPGQFNSSARLVPGAIPKLPRTWWTSWKKKSGTNYIGLIPTPTIRRCWRPRFKISWRLWGAARTPAARSARRERAHTARDSRSDPSQTTDRRQLCPIMNRPLSLLYILSLNLPPCRSALPTKTHSQKSCLQLSPNFLRLSFAF